MKTDKSNPIWRVFWSWSHVCGRFYGTETDLNAAHVCLHIRPVKTVFCLIFFFLWYFAFNSLIREWLLKEGEIIIMHHHRVESNSTSLFIYIE